VGAIELVGYSSATNGEKLVSKTIPIKDILNEDGSGWTLDLSKSQYLELQGPYYYELVYYVMPKEGSSNNIIKNEAGIGVQQGTSILDHTASWTGSGSYTFSYSKEYVDGLGTGEPSWKATIPVDIPAGATYVDKPRTALFNNSMAWFTAENIEGIRVMFNDTQLKCGTGEGDGDYYVTVKWNGDKGSEFTIQFNRPVTGVSSKNPVTIEYNMHIDLAKFPANENDSASHYTINNNSSLTLYGITQTASAKPVYETRVELKKTAGEYDKETGTMTWTLEVNRGSSIDGDATIREELPDGLSFISAEIIKRGAKAESTKLSTPTDENGNAVTEDTSTVLIPVTGLYQYTERTDKSQVSDGMITVRITTKVKDDERLTLDGTKTYTNKATLLADGLEISSTASQKITGHALSKTGVHNTNTYPYVKYTLNVNQDGMNLLENSDTITVVDEMTTAMRLAIEKSDYFVVMSDGEDITSQCTLVDNTNTDDSDNTSGTHTFRVTVPDDRPVTIEYYVAVNGVEGEEVTITNKAHYEGQSVVSGAEESKMIVIQASSASVSTGVRFSLLKMDSSRNPISDVTFALYKVELDSDGKAVLGEDGLPALTKVSEAVTAENGKITFGSEKLEKDAIYCYIERKAPDGYVIDTRRHYVEFTEHNNAGISGISGIVNDAILAVTNHFSGTSYQIPVVKKINGESKEGYEKEFSFTLAPEDSNKSWTDKDYKTLFKSGNASVTGTGRTIFDTLYFNATGTYLYTLTEDDITTADGRNGYTKDESTYQIKIVVGIDETNALTVTSATFCKEGEKTEQDLSKAAPVFDNTYRASGSIVFEATKELTGDRAEKIGENEFTFSVTENGTEVATGATLEGGNIAFTKIIYSLNDVGTHTYVISENIGEDKTIGYVAEPVTVTVTVSDNGDGTLSTQAAYPEGGAKFVNEYYGNDVKVPDDEMDIDSNETPTIPDDNFAYEEEETETVTETDSGTNTKINTKVNTDKSTDTKPQTRTTVTSVKTGDDMPVEFYTILLAVSVITLLFAAGKRRRKKSGKL
jgi:pilin isopeptide linkage protein